MTPPDPDKWLLTRIGTGHEVLRAIAFRKGQRTGQTDLLRWYQGMGFQLAFNGLSAEEIANGRFPRYVPIQLDEWLELTEQSPYGDLEVGPALPGDI